MLCVVLPLRFAASGVHGCERREYVQIVLGARKRSSHRIGCLGIFEATEKALELSAVLPEGADELPYLSRRIEVRRIGASFGHGFLERRDGSRAHLGILRDQSASNDVRVPCLRSPLPDDISGLPNLVVVAIKGVFWAVAIAGFVRSIPWTSSVQKAEGTP